MNGRPAGLLALLALTLAGCAPAEESGNPASPRAAVERYLARVERGDLEGARGLLCTDDEGRPQLELVAPGNPSFVTPERLGRISGSTFQSEGELAGGDASARWLRFDLRGGSYDGRSLGFAVRPEPATGFCVLYAL
jgi:hypothetical protein